MNRHVTRGFCAAAGIALTRGDLSGPPPLVRVHSRRDGEATYIFMSPASKSSKSTRVLIATFEHNEATVIEVKANIETLLKSLQAPAHAGRTLRE